jgi:hypothetical protein
MNPSSDALLDIIQTRADPNASTVARNPIVLFEALSECTCVEIEAPFCLVIPRQPADRIEDCIESTRIAECHTPIGDQ